MIDPFSDPFGSRGETYRARSRAVEVEVRPAPAKAGVNPWLPARQLELQALWPQDPPRLVQGEPVTLTLSLKAEGLTAAQLPDLQLPAIEGVKQYPDQPLLNDVRNDSGITGYRLQKIALIPTRGGELRIPEIQLAWWNVQTDKREVARIPAQTLQVIASANPPLQTPAAPAPTPSLPAAGETAKDRASPASTTAAATTGAKAAGYWPWVSLVLACGWALTLVLWWWSRRGRPAASPLAPTQPSRRIERAGKALGQLRKACAARDDEACRRQLLAWGRALFGDDFHLAGDALKRLPAELARLTRELDARLYGSGGEDLDHARIAEQAQSVTRAEAARLHADKPGQGLLPLDPRDAGGSGGAAAMADASKTAA
jgi:hypothetical protein